jgi:glutathione S-transferase
MAMKLHYSPRSPFARKVRIALIELGLEDRIDAVETAVSPVERNDAFTDVTPLRQVPALELDDGTVVVDSTAILLFLDDLVGGDRLLPRGKERWATLARHGLAQGMLEVSVNLRYEVTLRPEALRWDAWIADRFAKIDDTLAWFEARPRALEGHLDMGRIALAAELGYLDFRFTDHDWRGACPNLAGWYREAAARPSLVQTVPPA